MEAKLLPKLEAEGADPDLIQEALDKRFEEVRLYQMRGSLPGLLPKEQRPKFQDPDWDRREDPVPVWVTVIHGGVQGWWIAPVLGSLNEIPLMLSATVLTAFNDNAAITYLSTLVPGFTDGLKYAVVAGAVTGGGLTIIANAPNPAGQSILKRHFGAAISPMGLLMAALVPTTILWVCFALL